MAEKENSQREKNDCRNIIESGTLPGGHVDYEIIETLRGQIKIFVAHEYTSVKIEGEPLSYIERGIWDF